MMRGKRWGSGNEGPRDISDISWAASHLFILFYFIMKLMTAPNGTCPQPHEQLLVGWIAGGTRGRAIYCLREYVENNERKRKRTISKNILSSHTFLL
jgi:hypothetical protein